MIDFDEPGANDWLAVNQFTVIENKHSRRPDVVLFVNGLPLAVIELKNAADENATHLDGLQPAADLQGADPVALRTNAVLVISDGIEARIGTLTADRERFMPWRTIAGERLADPHCRSCRWCSRASSTPRRFLDLVRDFIVFEDDGGGSSRRRSPATTSSTRCGRR